ncbi:hypothetical protein M7I_4685 [Glarea lozoyensis 74030]|uniref:Uncharacterized protein n=1 Tax=Glarea lozoyensis (strain ATCC 74030 / MF5533) TaxID=1104152 RepID=H0EPU7_GLAL7|nr:hypothetical protein M7I_4685 [Glarea lozoyensis 74030]
MMRAAAKEALDNFRHKENENSTGCFTGLPSCPAC